jgi:hypothetical protein
MGIACVWLDDPDALPSTVKRAEIVVIRREQLLPHETLLAGQLAIELFTQVNRWMSSFPVREN